MASRATRRTILGRLLLLTAGLSLIAASGCNRAFYRRQADREVGNLVTCASGRLDRPMEQRFTINPDQKSRFHDNWSPDCPPMPPDDPTSHEYMNCVDGKVGYPGWDCHGRTMHVESSDWRNFLPFNDKGTVVINREMAMQMALINSPDYQEALENVYLSALRVTEERFRFDAQFYGGNSTLYTADGRLLGGDSTLDVDNFAGFTRRFSAGGELAVGLANSFMWQFAGPDTNAANTLLNFNFVQPLLRFGGRDVALENLTDSERALLGNIRQLERFRRGFYTEIVAGGGSVGTPTSGSPSITSGRSSGNLSASGFLGLLEEQVRIRNQEGNIAGLEESLYRLMESYLSGQINSLQVEQARQRLLESQSRLIALNNAYETRLDNYKMTLGLPPDLPLQVQDAMLDEFELLDPRLTQTQDVVKALLIEIRNPERPMPSDVYDRINRAMQETIVQLGVVEMDIDRLDEIVPSRVKNLKMLAGRPEVESGNVDQVAVDVDEFLERVRKLHENYPKSVESITVCFDRLMEMKALFENRPTDLTGLRDRILNDSPIILADFEGEITDQDLDALGAIPPGKDPALIVDKTPLARAMRKLTGRAIDDLLAELLVISLTQARARLDTVSLTPIELSPERALRIAAENRRDWMNARAELVDRWRQIEVVADELESDLDIVFDGQIDTVDDNPVKWRSSRGSLSVGLEFDAPLTRLLERNAYRRTLIEYQRAKRDFYTYRDGINQSLRSTLRTIRQSQLDFELRRAAVLVAIVQVDLAQLNLTSRQAIGNTNLSRDVTDALQELLDAQNNFLALWVDYEAQRMTLDLDLGTMQLDPYGMWVDPGEIVESEMVDGMEPRRPGVAGLEELPPGIEGPGVAPPAVPGSPLLVPPEEGRPMPPLPMSDEDSGELDAAIKADVIASP